jgi:hypothetical protein
MQKKLLITLMLLLALMIFPFTANAATITSCDVDKETYLQGQTGYITVRIFNDKEDTIRISKLTASIEYFYDDENPYVQTFFTDATLPAEIEQGLTDEFEVPFSLPNNIAPGYTSFYVKAETQWWNSDAERWQGSDHPTHEQTIYVESPYKEHFEEQQEANDQLQTTNQQLQGQLQEQQTLNTQVTTMVYILAATTVVFAALMGLLLILLKKTKITAQPAA